MKAIILMNLHDSSRWTERFYVSHLEPKSDVIMLVGRHFADRMPSEHWMIIDDKPENSMRTSKRRNKLSALSDG